MPVNALSATCQRFRDLILGAPVTTPHGVSSGTFREADKTVALGQMPAGVFHQKPFEVEWDDDSPADETGPDYLSGNLVDTSATIRVSVGYLMGVGKQVSVSDAAYEDSRLLRRVLEEPGNYDATNTGLVKVDWQRTRKSKPDADGRVVMDMTFRVRVREEQPQ